MTASKCAVTVKVLRGAAENQHALDARFILKFYKVRQMFIVCGVILRVIANKVIEVSELQHFSLIKLNWRASISLLVITIV